MIIIGSYERLCFGGLILAALLLLAYNGLVLMPLLNPTIIGQSEEVRLASRKWQKLSEKDSLIVKEIWHNKDIELIASRLGFDTSEMMADSSNQKKDDGIGIKLPSLTGIMQISDIHGNIISVAVIEGKRLVEKDEIKGFKIKNITRKGVTLKRAGKSWFITAPEVQFSVAKAKKRKGTEKNIIAPLQDDEQQVKKMQNDQEQVKKIIESIKKMQQ